MPPSSAAVHSQSWTTHAAVPLQAAKSVGSTLRSFAPTIREITSVSQELKSTLEQASGECW